LKKYQGVGSTPPLFLENSLRCRIINEITPFDLNAGTDPRISETTSRIVATAASLARIQAQSAAVDIITSYGISYFI
jgi:hypothetical protein